MTGLEAIEIIRDRLIEYKNKAEGTNIKCLISPQFAQVRTELKALDIIKEKNVDVSLIKKYDFVEDYNSAVWIAGRPKLVKEEYETIKEVLE